MSASLPANYEKERVDSELERIRDSIIKRARQVDPYQKLRQEAYAKKSHPWIYECFRMSKKLWQNVVQFEKQRRYDQMYFFLHQYLNMVLENKLHRLQRHETFARDSQMEYENLKLVEEKMNIALKGIRIQIEYKFQLENEHKREEQLIIERQEMERERKDREKRLRDQQELDQLVQVTHETDIKKDNATEVVNIPMYPTMDAHDLSEATVATVVPVTPVTPVHIINNEVNNDKVEIPSGKEEVDPLEKVKLTLFEKKNITGDGNCLFRAIASGLGLVKFADFGKDESKEAATLRAFAVQLLNRNQDAVFSSAGITVRQVAEMEAEDFDSYVAGMSRGAYGGELEMHLLAAALQANIHVYKIDGGMFKRMAKYGKAKGPNVPDVFLLWMKGMSESGNHYNLLVPKFQI